MEKLAPSLRKKKTIYICICGFFVAVLIGLITIFGYVLESREGVITCAILTLLSIFFLWLIVRIKVEAFDIKGQELVYYRFIYTIIYVDGEEEGRIFALNLNNSDLEFQLKDGTKAKLIISGSFTKVAFSDGRPMIDL